MAGNDPGQAGRCDWCGKVSSARLHVWRSLRGAVGLQGEKPVSRLSPGPSVWGWLNVWVENENRLGLR
jgi:hypothetical protein